MGLKIRIFGKLNVIKKQKSLIFTIRSYDSFYSTIYLQPAFTARSAAFFPKRAKDFNRNGV